MPRPERGRPALLLAAGLLTAVAAAAAAPRVDAPPTVSGLTTDYAYFSPDQDGARDTLTVFYELGGDSARVEVVVRDDADGQPGDPVRTLRDDTLAVGRDTLYWQGRADNGSRLPDGLYWITVSASNVLGSGEAPPASVILDTTDPEDAVTSPSRAHVSALIHRVEGWGYDASRLERFAVELSSTGGALTTVVCEPCLADTVYFALDVPDSIAAADSLTVLSELRDNAGNERLRPRLFVVDSLPPPPPELAALPATVERPQITVSGTAAEAESVLVSLDGAIAARVRVGSGSGFSATLRDLALGSHTVSAVSQDRALNRSPSTAPASFVYEEPLGASLPERFRSGDVIQVNLAQPARAVTVRIYTLAGRLVRVFEAGGGGLLHEFEWDLTDDSGRSVGSGPYVVRVTATREDGSALEKRLATVATR